MASAASAPAPVSGFDPDDPSAWLVLADWLTERGDPRGLLLSLNLAQNHGGGDPEQLAALRRAHLHRYHEALWPVFGVADEAGLREQVALRWVEGLVIAAQPLGRPGAVAMGARLRGLLDSEAALALAELHGDRVDPRVLVEVLAEGPPRPTIRALSLGDYRTPIPDLARAWAKLPGLRELSLAGPGIGLAGAPAARLSSLRLACELDPAPLAELARLELPRVRELVLRLGGDRYFGEADTDPGPLLGALLGDPRRLPALERLAITGVAFGDRLVAALAASPVLDQLRRLELSDSRFEPHLAPLTQLDRPGLRLCLRGSDVPLNRLTALRRVLGDRLE